MECGVRGVKGVRSWAWFVAVGQRMGQVVGVWRRVNDVRGARRCGVRG